MKKRRLQRKRRRFSYTSRRVHPLHTRRYCDCCGLSVNIVKDNGHSHTLEHLDYDGEVCDERTECRDCIESFEQFIEEDIKKLKQRGEWWA